MGKRKSIETGGTEMVVVPTIKSSSTTTKMTSLANEFDPGLARKILGPLHLERLVVFPWRCKFQQPMDDIFCELELTACNGES